MKTILTAFLAVLLFLPFSAIGETLKKEIQVASQGLTAVDWYNKAGELWVDGKYTDPKKVIEYLNNAIKLQPDYDGAHISRGNAYANLGQHQRAIEDFSQSIRLKPDYAYSYINRGSARGRLGQYQPAIEDFNEGIRLKPDEPGALNLRALAYLSQGKKNLGCMDRKARSLHARPDAQIHRRHAQSRA